MHTIGRFVRTWMPFLLVLTLILGIAGCDIAKITSRVEPLPTVTPLPTPQLPDWIEQISPTGAAEPLAQIRIRFKEPLIPVESLDSPQQQNLLNKFEILPPLKGQFRFLTPRMVDFKLTKRCQSHSCKSYSKSGISRPQQASFRKRCSLDV
jgi:hypothetical protein